MSVVSDESDYDNYTETSDSEDQDSEFTYGGNARSILYSLDESIGKIDDFLAYERGFVHGDIVCSIADLSGQLGRVIDVDMVVDLETRFGEPIKGVSSKKLQRVRSFVSGDHVIHGPWLGRVERLHDAITVVFPDGAKCEIMGGDSGILIPVSPRLSEDAPYPYFSGQRVRIKHPNISKSVRWLCGSVNATRSEGTVCNVEAGLVHVNWIASLLTSCAAIPPPPCLQNPKNLTLLSCFPYANWQLGDWCTLPSGCFSNLQMTSGNCSPPHTSCQDNTAKSKSGVNDRYWAHMYVITRTKTKVDVLWQNGSCSVGLDSQTLFPVNNVGDHDFWPGHFVLEKSASDDSDASSGTRSGVVKSVNVQDRTVKVNWKVPGGDANDEMVSVYELIEHPDFHSIGDIVFRALPHCEKLRDVPQAVRISEMKQWHDVSIKEAFDGSNLSSKEKELNSQYHEDASIIYLSSIGNVIDFKDECIEVRWATGLTSKVQPSEIFGLDMVGRRPIPVATEESASESLSEEMTDDEKKICIDKEKVISTEAFEIDAWSISSLLFPCASIGFFKSIAQSVFGPTSLLGFWKSVPEFHALQAKEAHLDDIDTELQSLKENAEQAELKKNATPTPSNEIPGMFKKFDVVVDYSDHHFAINADKGVISQVQRGWLKKVQQEWGILKKDLPDNIYVRVYERMDLLRACIVGAPGTPYHDSLFFFDVSFPPQYPHEPPMVHYNSGGLRLNPNLYESGKVCLSLLKTWSGNGTEVWDPDNSTVLQVLLSLQALVLNDKPYFNEAGYEKQMGRAESEKCSIAYNENAFLLSCRSMLYLLRKPPKHFEELVEEHFTCRSHHILLACKAYMDGAPVGRPREARKATGVVVGQEGCSTGFKIMLAKLFPKLVSGFTEKGIDCSQFRK